MIKSLIIIFSVIILLVAGVSAYSLLESNLFGWTATLNLRRFETNDFKSLAPKLTFKYSNIFDIDIDRDKKYGEGYLVGLKLKTDSRTGCDVRTNGPEINFGMSDTEISNSVIGPIQAKASDFKLLSQQRSKIAERDAFMVSFSFLDPIGARVRLDQLFTSNPDGQNFMIICGTGEYQFPFFEKDFRIFYDSIGFKAEVIPQKNTWQKLKFWEK